MGWGSSFDAYSVTKPDPEGRGGARAIQAALTEAQVDSRDVGYINAHGTSTRLNDADGNGRGQARLRRRARRTCSCRRSSR